MNKQINMPGEYIINFATDRHENVIAGRVQPHPYAHRGIQKAPVVSGQLLVINQFQHYYKNIAKLIIVTSRGL